MQPIVEKPYLITRTRSKRYIGQCSICGWTTAATQHRIDVAGRLRDHCRVEHDTWTEDIFNTVVNRSLTRNRKGHDVPITQPGAKLPETDAERLSDYDGSLVVFANAKPGERDTSFGARETREVLAYVVVSGEWKALGETPIFFKTVIKQIDEADGEPLGGILKKGTERNANEWAIVPTTKKADLALLDNWTEESGSEPF